MKKILLFAGAALLSLTASAQKAAVSNAEKALIIRQWDEAKKDIDLALENEKTANEPNTYIVAAKVYASLAANDKADDGIVKAKEFIEKAKDLDAIGGPKGKKIGKAAKDIEKARFELANKAGEMGSNFYNSKNYKKSLEGFLFQNEMLSQTKNYSPDTTLLNNIGIVAMQAEDYKVGAEYFHQAALLFKGNPQAESDGVMAFRRMKYCYEQLGDSVNAEKALKEGFEAYQSSQDIITELINYYLQAQKNEEALVYLNEAIQKDPNNAQFYFARGCLNEKNSFEAAEADYKKAIELDNKNFNAYNNLAIIYYNKSLEVKTNASAERDMAKYNAMMEEFKTIMAKAAPYFEKAAEVAPDNNQKRDVLTNLQKTYYNIGEYTKSGEVKAKIDALN